ncbi:MAG: hypothetical protein N3C12_10525 [Candidatus Binatia bacterium]|nr:hypothetical protein [Candidatus Binatia bacterium]
MTDRSLADAIRKFAAERHYRPQTVEQWISLEQPDAAALLHLASSLRLGCNQLRDLWEIAAEIALRDQTTIAAVLRAPEIEQVLQAKLSRNDRLQRIKHLLRRRRFPTLTAAEERARTFIQAGGFPPTIRISLPQFLEGDEILVTCRAKTPEELRAQLAALSRWAEGDFCARLFALLGGEA